MNTDRPTPSPAEGDIENGRVSRRVEVLVVSNRTDGCAELAAALLVDRHGDRVRVSAAGGFPAGDVQSEVNRVGQALGIDVVSVFPARLTTALVNAADLVIALDQTDRFDGDRLPHVHRWDLPRLTDHHFDSYLELAAVLEDRINTLPLLDCVDVELSS